jgi:hypothetical protein
MAEWVDERDVLPRAPEELTRGRLKRIGEGVGKVVYASENWVVKRERHPSESLALIAVWKAVRTAGRLLPGRWADRALERPGRGIRLLHQMFRAVVLVAPRSAWFSTNIFRLWRSHYRKEARGARLAAAHLAGTGLVPRQISFPPTRVKVGRWPGWVVVSEATERVEGTLHDKINDLARSLRFDEIDVWLERFLALRQAGWQLGLFSADAHLKNFGVTADRVVLLDTGALTDRWENVEKRLRQEDRYSSPHERLGLEWTLRDRPDIAEKFDRRWRECVNPEAVREHWPE